MNDMTEFQQRAAAIALVQMFQNKSFSICSLDAIAKTMGRTTAMAGRDYAALRTLHCVDWTDMGPDLTRMTQEKCLELLGLPAQTIEAVCVREKPSEPAHEPAKRLRLAFWK